MPYRNAQSCNYNEYNAIKTLNISSFVTNYFCSRNAPPKSLSAGLLRSFEMLRRAAARYRRFVTVNKNNNNIYLLQLGCHPVAVVILHVNRT